MLDLNTRTAILRLAKKGHGVRTIAKALRMSRNAVREVVRSGVVEVPALEERLSKSLDTVRTLHAECRGNLVRVMEKLADHGLAGGYLSALAGGEALVSPPRRG